MNVYEAKTLEVQSAETSAKTSATTRGSSMTNHDRSILKHNPAYFRDLIRLNFPRFVDLDVRLALAESEEEIATITRERQALLLEHIGNVAANLVALQSDEYDCKECEGMMNPIEINHASYCSQYIR